MIIYMVKLARRLVNNLVKVDLRHVVLALTTCFQR